MKRISKFVLAILMMSVCAVLPTQAQNAGSQKYEYDFNPHWFIQLQGGGQYTLGEVEFGKLLSPNVQFAVGYEFNPVVKGRFSVNAWQSKAGIEGKWADLGNNGTPLYWKWKYVAPSVDVMFDLTNFLGGYKPEERKFSIGVFAGLGANIGFANDEAYDANNELKTRFNRLDPNEVQLKLLWDDPFKKEPISGERGTNAVVRFGAFYDYRLNDNWSIGLEANANIVGDSYNSKKAANPDWYFNGLVGVKYCFGQTYSKRPAADPVAAAVAAAMAAQRAPERPVERVVERVEVEKQVPYLYQEIYFTINKYNIAKTEEYKVSQIADFLKNNPDAKVEITGHADSKTGTKAINQTLSEKRAAEVAKKLTDDYGISSSRITTVAKGDTANFYGDSSFELNRVCVCIGK